MREATRYAVNIAEKAGILRSFDPNLRPPLWNSLEEAKRQICWGLAHCDILKISQEELEFVTGKTDMDEGAVLLRASYPISLLCVTAGPGGSRVYYKNLTAEQKAYLLPDTIETTGAGDTFAGSVLNFVLDHGLDHLGADDLKEMLSFANAAAALVTTRKGALAVMPCAEEVLKLKNS